MDRSVREGPQRPGFGFVFCSKSKFMNALSQSPELFLPDTIVKARHPICIDSTHGNPQVIATNLLSELS